MDVGTSGGVFGARNGAYDGRGERFIYNELAPLFQKLCVKKGCIYSGPAGSGHYLKMVHNGLNMV